MTGKPGTLTELFVWVVEQPDGRESVIATRTPDGPLPLVAAERSPLERVEAFAQSVARLTGHPVRLKSFTLGSVLAEIMPGEREGGT